MRRHNSPADQAFRPQLERFLIYAGHASHIHGRKRLAKRADLKSEGRMRHPVAAIWRAHPDLLLAMKQTNLLTIAEDRNVRRRKKSSEACDEHHRPAVGLHAIAA